MIEHRISKLKDYLYQIINEMVDNNKYQINADFLGKVGDYSLDRIPTATQVEKWITGDVVRKDTYSFRSRKYYSQDVSNNLENIGFFEKFEDIIKSNNDEGILPDIDGIQSIECMNSGTLSSVDGTQATFNIQIQITYLENTNENVNSL